MTTEALLYISFTPEVRGRDPSLDALIHLLYGLDLLYADSFSELPVTRDGSRWEWIWHEPARQWIEMLEGAVRGARLNSPTSVPSTAWPDRVPTPLFEWRMALRVRSIVLASPMELVLAIPVGALATLGVVGLVRLLKAIENTWHMPKRIRVEGAELDRDYWEARLDADKARLRHFHYYGQGFEVNDAWLDLPAAPKLPEGDGEST